MPDSAPKVCPVCRGLSCGGHPSKRWGLDNSDGRIGGGRRGALRKKLLKQFPWCVECRKSNRWVLAVIRDHIVPLAEGGTEDPSNTQGLCLSCHTLKTRAETRRGQWRSR